MNTPNAQTEGTPSGDGGSQMNHTQILNRLAEVHGYQKYLEIGVQNPENNFNKIICREKYGVDPVRAPDHVKYDGEFYQMDSNAFFRMFSSNGGNAEFDLIFIDGLHEWEQCLIDIINSIKMLDTGGSIVIHDLLPVSRSMQAIPRTSKEWTGDVWRAWMYAEQFLQHDFSSWEILDCDYGVGVLSVYHGTGPVNHLPEYDDHIMDMYRQHYVVNPADWIPERHSKFNIHNLP